MALTSRFITGVALALMAVTASAAEIHVADGDVQGLKNAVASANESGEPTEIRLAGTFRFGQDDGLPPITGDIVLRARELPGSKPVFEGSDLLDQLIRVETGASLTIDGVRFEAFLLSKFGAPVALIENHGALRIVSAEFSNLRAAGGSFFTPPPRGLIANHGTLSIERTTFLDVINRGFRGAILINRAGTAELSEVLTASRDLASEFGIANLGGFLRISNATLAAQESALFTGDGATTELVNSVIPGPRVAFSNEIRACSGPVISLGNNLVADTSCQLNGPDDLQGVSTGTFPLSVVPGSSGVVPVIRLAGASPAVDSANPAWCGEADVRGRRRVVDGNNDGIAVCDRGALELIQRRLTDGGINGLYHVPDNDGHYISVLDNPNNTLIIWNTFDREGRQAWIYGVGEIVNGRSVVADAYTNENGVLTGMGPVDAETGVPWGTIILEMESCNQGRMLFSSDRPEFGSGEFQFRRLASVRQLGCAE